VLLPTAYKRFSGQLRVVRPLIWQNGPLKEVNSMNRRKFIIFLISLGLIPAAYGAYNLIGESQTKLQALEEFLSRISAEQLQALKKFLGINVDDQQAIKEIIRSRIADNEEVPISPSKLPPLEEFLGVPVPKGMDEETFYQILDQVDEKVIPAVLAPIDARVEELKAQGLYWEEIKKRIKEEGLDKETLRRWDELRRPELIRLFAEWEQKHKAR